MHFKFSLMLNVPRERAWRAFNNPANLRHWQPSLVSYEPLDGNPGQPGATARLIYQEGDHRIELHTTIGVRREPEESQNIYDSVHGRKVLTSRFVALDEGHTRWDLEAQLTFKGAAKLMAPMLRGRMEQRIRTDADRFKTLLETGELET